MAVKTLYDFHEVPTQNTAEIVINVPSAVIIPDIEQRLFDPDTLVITTGTGGTGTLLIAGVDYVFQALNDYATIKVGLDVYSEISITNATYFNTDLYIEVGTLNLYGDRVLAEDVNSLQGQIDALSGGYDTELIHDLSGSAVDWGLDAFFAQSDGYLQSWAWYGGDGTNQATFSEGVGKTIGTIAIASILPDLVGDGQGRLTLRKEGNNARLIAYHDSDGGNFSVSGDYTGVSFNKDSYGVTKQTALEEFVEATNVASGTALYRSNPAQVLQSYPVSMKQFDSSSVYLFEDDTAVCWVVTTATDASYNRLQNWRSYYIMRSASSVSSQNFKVAKKASGRWTTTHPIVG